MVVAFVIMITKSGQAGRQVSDGDRVKDLGLVRIYQGTLRECVVGPPIGQHEHNDRFLTEIFLSSRATACRRV